MCSDTVAVEAAKIKLDVGFASFAELAAAGYSVTPVVPVGAQISPRSRLAPAQRGKAPGKLCDDGWQGFRGWEDAPEPDAQTLAAWTASGANVGVRLGGAKGVYALDADVKVDDGATGTLTDRKRRLAARISELACAALDRDRGGVPLRWRDNNTSQAIFLQSAPELRKRKITFHDVGAEIGAVEFLGTGQQIVVAGIHFSGTPNRCNLVEHRADRLPELAVASIDRLFADIAAAAQELGFTVDERKTRRSKDYVLPPILSPDLAVPRAVMLRREEWVQEAIGPGVHIGRAGEDWRISSEELGRDLQKDVAIYPDGVQDFGEEKPQSAIDFICKFGSPERSKDEAFLWLADLLGGPGFYVSQAERAQPGYPVLARALGLDWEALNEASLLPFMMEPDGADTWRPVAVEECIKDAMGGRSEKLPALEAALPAPFAAALASLEGDGWIDASSLAATTLRHRVAFTARSSTEARRSDEGDERNICSLNGDIDADDDPPREWAVYPLYPRYSASMMLGAEGISKSSFMIRYGLAICCNRPDMISGLNGESWERLTIFGRVLLICAEDTVQEFRRRARAYARKSGIAWIGPYCFDAWQGVERPLTLFKRDASTGDINPGPGLAPFVNRIRATKPVFVIIDPYRSLGIGLQENSSEDMRLVVAKLNAIASTERTTILLVHHETKGARHEIRQTGDMTVGSGSGAIIGTIRGGSRLQPVQDTNRSVWGLPAGRYVQLEHGKANYSEKSGEVVVFRVDTVRIDGRAEPPPPFNPYDHAAEVAYKNATAAYHQLIGRFTPGSKALAPAGKTGGGEHIREVHCVLTVLGDKSAMPLNEARWLIGDVLRAEGLTKATKRDALDDIVKAALAAPQTVSFGGSIREVTLDCKAAAGQSRMIRQKIIGSDPEGAGGAGKA